MKTIGLLGGMRCENTVSDYRTINQGVKDALGGLHSAGIVLHSVDFDPIEKLRPVRLALKARTSTAQSNALGLEIVKVSPVRHARQAKEITICYYRILVPTLRVGTQMGRFASLFGHG